MIRKLFVLCICSIVFFGCETSGIKIKVKDPLTGNSITVSDDGLDVDVKFIETDSFVVEVVGDDKEGKE